MRQELLRPWQLSFMIHAATASLLIILARMPLPAPSVIEVPIEVSTPKEAQKLMEVQEKPKVVLKSVNQPSTGEAREIFGASRRSHTDESDAEGLQVKKGTTLTKEADREILKDSDADSLPVPTEEYLVSEMPSVLSEVRPLYPKEAREKQLEGAVVMEVLIDNKGVVREVGVIEGPEIFRNLGVEAMRKFRFSPAKVDGNPVAVKIRYTLKFQLDY
jgi:protein TonB